MSDPTMMRTEFTLRSNTFAADGSSFQFPIPPVLNGVCPWFSNDDNGYDEKSHAPL